MSGLRLGCKPISATRGLRPAEQVSCGPSGRQTRTGYYPRVDYFASQPHYSAHLRPVHAQLGGRVFGTARARWGEATYPVGCGPMCVASAVDAQRFSHRPVVYLEHGAGQSYTGDPAARSSPSYAGGLGLGNVRLFICPSQRVADMWQATYPDTATAVVGCPRLDRSRPRRDHARRGRARVLFVWHWECRLCPETRTAWPYWRAVVLDYATSHGNTAGHAHPRAPQIDASMRSLGMETFGDVDDALDWADVVVGDNTSVLYEACAIGLSTVVLNAPWYRRDIEHGMRFWSTPPGPQIDDPAGLADMISRVAADPDYHAAIRHTAAVAAYDGLVDGQAAWRAAAAIRAAGLA